MLQTPSQFKLNLVSSLLASSNSTGKFSSYLYINLRSHDCLRSWRPPCVAASVRGGLRAWRPPFVAASVRGGLRSWRPPCVAASVRGGLRAWRPPFVAASVRGGLRAWRPPCVWISFVTAGFIQFALGSFYADCPHKALYNEFIHEKEEHAS